MVNPKTMATLGTQDTGRRKKPQKTKTISVIKLISFFFFCLQTFIKYFVHDTVSNCWRFFHIVWLLKLQSYHKRNTTGVGLARVSPSTSYHKLNTTGVGLARVSPPTSYHKLNTTGVGLARVSPPTSYHKLNTTGVGLARVSPPTSHHKRYITGVGLARVSPSTSYHKRNTTGVVLARVSPPTSSVEVSKHTTNACVFFLQ